MNKSNNVELMKRSILSILFLAIIQNSIASDKATEAEPFMVSDAAHIFALDPFGINQITRHATIDNILEHLGLPIKIEMGDEVVLQFSKYVPVEYIYPGFKFTFGFESYWIHSSGATQVKYQPFKVIEKVQSFSITSSEVKLRNGIHVGMKWDAVVQKLGNPYEGHSHLSSDSYTHRSNKIYYDLTEFRGAVTFKFEVDEKRNVIKIEWPSTKSH